MAGTLKIHSADGVIATDDSGNAMLLYGSAAPADNRAGFGKGCLFLNRANTSLDDAMYVNIGTASACNFDPIQSA